ncbi:prolyl oligopeptidase family serine peptidase [Streptomyces sp. NPDC097619]|uniref:prolyl oligopeptidase family serine peptidase n=1 Tax=Streptomyces sp. NPDC097619 TaxID=3157228 RepID=UPI00331A39F4
MNDADPYLWLEDVTGDAALDWVRERNAETVAELASDPGFDPLRADLREVLDAADRIPYTTRRGAHLYNFWQDARHVRGLWRRTTLEEYRTEDPAWEVLLDLDALAADEGEDWVWAGSRVLYPEYRHALVLLSREGADAVVVREFDLTTRSFVPDGFRVPEAKTRISWIDRDHVFVGTDWGPGSMTESGYPRTVRRWKRGTPLESAEPVHEGAHEDLSVAAWHDPTGGFERDLLSVHRDFWRSDLYLLEPGDVLRRIEVPEDADTSVHRDRLLVSVKTPWLDRPAGSLLAFRLDAFLAGEREPEVLFTPDERTALTGWSWTRSHLVLELLSDVSTRIEVLTPGPEGWARQPLADVPPLSTASLTDTDPYTGEEYFLDITGHLKPSTLYRGEIGGTSEVLRQATVRFDAEGLAVAQHFAVSADGTRVPYFVIGPADRERRGPSPTILNGYGGFEVSLTPAYSAVRGRAWLARGGTYVVANIRGGGEYGPAWHRSALKSGRDRSYEDFAAVAEDLVARGITTPARLGITGGSNGGLLMGAMLTRRPELFGAIAAAVPLLDMLRFHRLLAGASWVAEYGDPEDPTERPYLEGLSPYHRLRADAAYPPVLLTTSTRDDRVHPGHARKTAARLRELGHRVLFHENTSGGHSGAADHDHIAFNQALVHTFMWRSLGGAETSGAGAESRPAGV